MFVFRPTHSPAPIRRRPTWTHRISLVAVCFVFPVAQQASGLYVVNTRSQRDRDVSVLPVSWQLSNVSRLDLMCCGDVVGVVGKFARVLLGLISGATMKAVIYASFSPLGPQ